MSSLNVILIRKKNHFGNFGPSLIKKTFFSATAYSHANGDSRTDSQINQNSIRKNVYCPKLNVYCPKWIPLRSFDCLEWSILLSGMFIWLLAYAITRFFIRFFIIFYKQKPSNTLTLNFCDLKTVCFVHTRYDRKIFGDIFKNVQKTSVSILLRWYD